MTGITVRRVECGNPVLAAKPARQYLAGWWPILVAVFATRVGFLTGVAQPSVLILMHAAPAETGPPWFAQVRCKSARHGSVVSMESRKVAIAAKDLFIHNYWLSLDATQHSGHCVRFSWAAS
jgi:hypothetical protein